MIDSTNGHRNGKNGRYAHIVGWGKYIPEKVMTNHDLQRIVDTSDEWITSRTGIRERRIAAEDESTATMGLAAAKDALEMAGVRPHEIDMVIVASLTPEYAFPATASVIQDALGASKAGAFDLSAGCAGFMYALELGTQTIRAGAHDVVLVIGSETLSRILNWKDRTTCVLFGDGAGAVVLRAHKSEGGVMSSFSRSDGSGANLLGQPGGGSKHPTTQQTLDDELHYVHMNGREVFRFAARIMGRSAREVIQDSGMKIEDVDLIIPHQANLRIIQSAARSLKLPMDRFFVNLQKYGNTSSASIPIALCEAVEEGRLKPGDKCVMIGFGSGLSWSAALVEWTGARPSDESSSIESAYERLLYVGAGIRSTLLRGARRVESVVGGTPSPRRVDKDKVETPE